MSQQNNEKLTRCQAITNLIDSVAAQEEALSKILMNMDDKPHFDKEYGKGYSGFCKDPEYDPDEDKEENEEKIELINAVTRLEFFLAAKLWLFADCACPKEGCRNKDKKD